MKKKEMKVVLDTKIAPVITKGFAPDIMIKIRIKTSNLFPFVI